MVTPGILFEIFLVAILLFFAVLTKIVLIMLAIPAGLFSRCAN